MSVKNSRFELEQLFEKSSDAKLQKQADRLPKSVMDWIIYDVKEIPVLSGALFTRQFKTVRSKEDLTAQKFPVLSGVLFTRQFKTVRSKEDLMAQKIR